MKREYYVSEYQFRDKSPSIYKGMNCKNIVPNTCFKNDNSNDEN